MDANSGDQAFAVGPRQRARNWLSARGLRQWLKAGLAVILAFTAIFGGLDTVNTSATSIEPGDEFSDGEFAVTVERATLVLELRAGNSVLAPAKPDRRYLGVIATVRANGTIPGRLSGVLDLRDQPDNQFVGVMRLTDGSRVITLGPGLAEQLAFVWELPENALAAGDSVTLRLWRKEFRQGLVTYGDQWVDSLTDYGEVVMPVGLPT